MTQNELSKVDDILNEYFDGVQKLDYISPLKAKDQLYELMLGVIGEGEKILVRPEPIRGIDNLWLQGKAEGEFTGKNNLRAEQRAKLKEVFNK